MKKLIQIIALVSLLLLVGCSAPVESTDTDSISEETNETIETSEDTETETSSTNQPLSIPGYEFSLEFPKEWGNVSYDISTDNSLEDETGVISFDIVSFYSENITDINWYTLDIIAYKNSDRDEVAEWEDLDFVVGENSEYFFIFAESFNCELENDECQDQFDYIWESFAT